MQILDPVTDTATLSALCQRLRAYPFVCIDTEFMREHTYWPILCLVQVAGAGMTRDDEPGVAAAIDPMAEGIDLQPLWDLFADENVLKVLHAGGQDMEIFHHLTGRLPTPLFDTQVAAMALGLGEQVSYANLVSHYTGRQLDKGARFTDWARRPLSDRQLEYAIGDVTHLSVIFPKMLDKLRRSGRGVWLDEEMARVIDPASYAVDPEQAWRRLRLPSRKADVLGRLKAAARWRELEAQDKDVPRGRIMRDETLADLSAQPPRTQADLAKIRGLSAAWATNAIGARLLAALRDAPPLSAAEMPPREAARPGLSTDAALVADILKLLLKVRAKEAKIAPRLIARPEELEALAAGQRDIPLLSGWRREAFGADALSVAEGRVAFRVENGRLTMTGGSWTPDAVAAEDDSPIADPGDEQGAA